MILLVAQLILQNCPTFHHDLAPPLDGAPRRSRGSWGIVTPLSGPFILSDAQNSGSSDTLAHYSSTSLILDVNLAVTRLVTPVT